MAYRQGVADGPEPVGGPRASGRRAGASAEPCTSMRSPRAARGGDRAGAPPGDSEVAGPGHRDRSLSLSESELGDSASVSLAQ